MSLSRALRLKDVSAAHAAIMGRAATLDSRIAALAGVQPTITSDLTTGQAWLRGAPYALTSLPGWSFSRALAAYGETSAGVLQSFASGAPRLVNGRGQLIEGARTNKCTNYNVALPALVTPAALATFNAAATNLVAAGGDGNTLFGIVDDAAALATVGLSGAVTNGRVIKIDNSAGAATAFINLGGTTGNTNSHTMSAYLRANAPVTSAPMTFTGGSGNNFDITTAYKRYTQTFTPGAGTNQSTLRCPAGSVMYYILNQLEEGAFVSSPIPVAGASATRPADIPLIDISAYSPAITYPLTMYARFELNVIQGGSDIIGLDTLTNGSGIYDSNGVTRAWVRTASVTTANVPGGAATLTAGVSRRIAARMENDNVNASYGGEIGTADTAAGLSYTPLSLKLGPALFGGQGFLYLSEFAIIPGAVSDANLVRLAA